jgi:hypothetical protein
MRGICSYENCNQYLELLLMQTPRVNLFLSPSASGTESRWKEKKEDSEELVERLLQGNLGQYSFQGVTYCRCLS